MDTTCSYLHPSDAELSSVIKMKMQLPVISLVAGDHPPQRNQAFLPKSDIGNAVAKVLQGYDWNLVPLANR